MYSSCTKAGTFSSLREVFSLSEGVGLASVPRRTHLTWCLGEGGSARRLNSSFTVKRSCWSIQESAPIWRFQSILYLYSIMLPTLTSGRVNDYSETLIPRFLYTVFSKGAPVNGTTEPSG